MAAQAESQGDQSSHDGTQRLLEFIRRHRRKAVGGGVGVLVVAGGVWFTVAARARSELFAERAIQTARASVSAGNLPLAANDLSRVVSTFEGTRAADQASILLAHVRLLRGQAPLAVTELRSFIQSGPPTHLKVAANALLAIALEEAGQAGAAATAYEAASEASRFDFLTAEYLVEAGRTHVLAGDTSAAVRAYQTVVEEYLDTPSNSEARMRLAELGR